MCFCDKSYIRNGYACFYVSDNKLFAYLDNCFKGFIDNWEECEEYHIPAIIDGEVLEKCGYFKSFPQHLTAAAFIKPEFYGNVVANKKVNTEYIGVTNKYLTPAACLHVYPMLEGEECMANKVITTRARVYRYEGENFNGLTRLWDFTVRELVFVGDREYVSKMLEEIKVKALSFAQKITGQAKISAANDHFYPSKENMIKIKMQQVNPFKFELLIPIKGEEVAVASFNYHDTHFSKPFNFENNNKIVTGCIGFGLERWVAACKEYNKTFNQEHIKGGQLK